MKRFFTLFLFLFCVVSHAKIYITVSDAQAKRAKLAISKMHLLPDSRAVSESIVDDVYEEIKKDLLFTGLFDMVGSASYAHMDTTDRLYQMNYEEWSLSGAAFVLKLGYRVVGNLLTVEALMYDVPGRVKIFSTRYEHELGQSYRLVHALAEDVLRELTGEKGLFRSRVLMVCRSLARDKGRVPKEIYIADADGKNLKKLTQDNTISLSPSWSPDGRSITYTQYQRRVQFNLGRKQILTIPVLKTHYLQNGKRRIISERVGMNSGAAWSPAGDKIAMTLSFSGRPEIYLVNPDGAGEPDPLSRVMKLRRLSGMGFQPNYASTLFDVEPSWAPDGGQIVFSSARTGHPMIYVMNIRTQEARQLTFAGQYNASPAWSPKGDKILFAAQHHATGNFDLYIIDPDGNNLARLTEGGKRGGRKVNYENSSWAPTGRHFAYSSNEAGHYQIFSRTLEGNVIRKISPDGMECTSPSWGPYEG